MRCSRNDVVLLPIPFTDLSSSKVRPAIVVGHGGFLGDLLVVPVTSQLASADFSLTSWQSAGLNVPSGVKAQRCTIEDALVRKIVGRLNAKDVVLLDQNLRQWLQL